MKNTYIYHNHFSGPENITICQLSATDLYEIQRALNIAEMSIPTEECIALKEKIRHFLSIHYNYKF